MNKQTIINQQIEGDNLWVIFIESLTEYVRIRKIVSNMDLLEKIVNRMLYTSFFQK